MTASAESPFINDQPTSAEVESPHLPGIASLNAIPEWLAADYIAALRDIDPDRAARRLFRGWADMHTYAVAIGELRSGRVHVRATAAVASTGSDDTRTVLEQRYRTYIADPENYPGGHAQLVEDGAAREATEAAADEYRRETERLRQELADRESREHTLRRLVQGDCAACRKRTPTARRRVGTQQVEVDLCEECYAASQRMYEGFGKLPRAGIVDEW